MNSRTVLAAALLVFAASLASLPAEAQCSDECTSGSTMCSSDRIRMCGNFDSDSCLEWSSYTPCGQRDCDFLDTSCRNYHDADRGCFNDQRCRSDSEIACTTWSDISSSSSCYSSLQPNPAACPNKCVGDVWHYDGRNVSGACLYATQDCRNLSRESSSRYCSGNEVRARYDSFFCSDGCRSVSSERTVASCETYCTDGVWRRISSAEEERRIRCDEFTCFLGDCTKTRENFVISRRDAVPGSYTIERTKTISFPVNVSSTTQSLDFPSAKLSNGLLFGNAEFSLPVNTSRLTVRFTVTRANLMAPLLISAGNDVLYENTTGPGSYLIIIEKQFSDVLHIGARSSGIMLWSPNEYGLANITIGGVQASRENIFDFIVQKEEYERFTSASITPLADATVWLNNRSVSGTVLAKDHFVHGTNRIRFVPAHDTSTTSNVTLTMKHESTVTAGQ